MFFLPYKMSIRFLTKNPGNPAKPLLLPMATFWNPNMYNPLSFYPINYVATQTSYVHDFMATICMNCLN